MKISLTEEEVKDIVLARLIDDSTIPASTVTEVTIRSWSDEGYFTIKTLTEEEVELINEAKARAAAEAALNEQETTPEEGDK